MKIYDHFAPYFPMTYYSDVGYVIFSILLSIFVLYGISFFIKSVHEKKHWIFKLRIILGTWLVVGVMLHVYLAYVSEPAENMFYVGLGSWVTFIAVVVASRFAPKDPLSVPRKYDDQGKRSFSYEQGFGIFKDSVFGMGVSERKNSNSQTLYKY